MWEWVKGEGCGRCGLKGIAKTEQYADARDLCVVGVVIQMKAGQKRQR